ncbi:MAG TPA: hypothetical protein VIR31_03670 [Nitrososphaeraceae archaeon]
MNKSDLKGNFHCHITYSGHKRVSVSGWKDTIIIINKDDRFQEDVMITRHYFVPSKKTPTLQDVIDDIHRVKLLIETNVRVTRWKLEHESLPTIPTTDYNYRECHIKIRIPRGYQVIPPDGFVMSRNAMEKIADTEVYFLNARFYKGTIDSINETIQRSVSLLKRMNPLLMVLEVKEETTIFDSNFSLDSWWA